MTEIKHFLLVFDHTKGKLVAEEHFGTNGPAALEAYAQAEANHRGDELIDIVLVGSDSIDTVKLTHANYFDGSVGVSQYLVGI